MKPKRRIQLMILAAIVFGSLAWLMIYPLDDPADFAEKVRQQGTNAVPQLLEMLQAKDSKFKTKLIELSEKQNLVTFHFHTASDSYDRAVDGFNILGTNAGFAAPALIKIFEENISEESRRAILAALMELGSPGAEAVFYCFDHPDKTNAEFRAWALWWISNAELKPKVWVPLSIRSLKDLDVDVRRSGVFSLWRAAVEPDVSSAIPALTEALNDPDGYVRYNAAQALKQMQREPSVKTDEKQK